jgi:vacuolar-type H+-ATPase subunit H
MGIEDILAMMDEVLDKAVAVPFSRKSLIDVEKMSDLIHEVRMNLPREIESARGVVSERKQLLTEANRDADKIIKRAEERARQMVSNQEVARLAQARAEEIMMNAHQKSKELRHTTNDYVDNMLVKTEEMFAKNLTDVKKARAALRNAGK